MSALAAILGALSAVGDALKALFGWLGVRQQQQAEADQRDVGATAAEDETALDTAEIADAQAKVNSDHPDVRDIARELRAEADAADGGGHVAGDGAGAAR
ncbi:MAG: hypothetical protein QM651_15085, partial [Rhodoblastus sp.]